MRLLSLLPFSPPCRSLGGAELQVHDLHKSLLARGWKVDVLADEAVFPGSACFEHEGVRVWPAAYPIVTSNPFRPGNLKLLLALRSTLALACRTIPCPDIIMSVTMRQPCILGHLISQRLGVPHVARMAASGEYGDFKWLKSNWIGRFWGPRVVCSLDALIALEESTKREALAEAVPADKINVISNAILREPAESQSAFGPEPGKEKRILFVGRLAPQKDVATLIRAFARLKHSQARLVLVGDGDQRDQLRSLTHELSVHDRVDFTGWLEDPFMELKRADVFVNPSQSEGLPNSVLEALAAGIPTVLSSIPVHYELAQAADLTRYLFPFSDDYTLAESISSVLTLPPDATELMRQRVKQASAKFSRGARDDAYESLFQKAISDFPQKCRR
jgi:glycosyltransferase involved in cell wall biosynthesis